MKHTFTLLFFFCSALGAKAQQAFPATGSDVSGSGGTVNYTIGQVVYTTDSSPQGTITKGVQQPYEILTISVKEEAKNIQLNVYPNPTKDFLQLSFEHSDLMQISYQLFENTGKLIEEKNADHATTMISMNGLASATYFLKIYSKGQEIKTFKIIKN